MMRGCRFCSPRIAPDASNRIPHVKRILAASLVAFSFACATARTPAIPPAEHGAVTIEIIPNPVVARHLDGNTYEFPFEVVVRETGGHPVSVARVHAEVYALGG